ncbi:MULTISPECIES: hypothetical protein [unclassified Paenibacillus]|uniref:hypothetical protein n=1 Tax=unclassified Paenibacillus TaxID=185978 RepID=UPI0027895AC5|nr:MULTISPECIES: hypothetical protein [unclassified Paenibacillus]MDQ0896290.1 hypothetical protein [Paenibacillus sp. V4I7]MDQ0913782.1 hypothetical protein [Paenibacillus sp. V4I5]
MKLIGTLKNMFKRTDVEQGTEIVQNDAQPSEVPTSNDPKWGELNQRTMKYATEMKWGLYRNVRLDMANILLDEHRLADGLRMLLYVCYIDLNGPRNSSPNLVGLSPMFTPDNFLLAPGVLGMVEDTLWELKFDLEQAKKIFIEHNSTLRNSLMPLSPQDAWVQLEKELVDRSIKFPREQDEDE